MKKIKLLKTLLVAIALICTAVGLVACSGGGGGGNGNSNCEDGSHTFVCFSPSGNSREQMISEAEKNGIKMKNGESFISYVMSEKFNVKTVIYDSEYDDKGDIYYMTKHYLMCTNCGEIKMEEHNFAPNNDGATETSHNVTCQDCGYSHQEACNFKGENQNSSDDDGDCFCGKTAPVYIATTLSDTTVMLEIKNSLSGEVVIPSTYQGKTVTEVAFGEINTSHSNLLNNCVYDAITSITIPSTITKVYGWDSNTASSYPNNTFPNLLTINIEGVINGANTYFNRFYMASISQKLETVNAPNCYMSVNASKSVNIKGGSANAPTVTISDINDFYCQDVDTLNIPESVTEIPESFSYTFDVRVVNAPGVTSIGKNAFYEDDIEEFNAPNLEYIGNNAFYGCSKLSKLNLVNVKYFGERCLYNCTKLKNIVVDTTGTVEIEYRAFEYNSIDGTEAFENLSITATTIDLKAVYMDFKKVELFADTININSSIASSVTEEVTIDGNLVNFYCDFGTNLGENFKTLNYNVANAGEGVMSAYYPSPYESSVTYNVGPKVKTLPKLDDGESWPPHVPFTKIVFDENCQIETIGAYTFAGVAITEMTLPNSVEEVEPFAFYASTLETLRHSSDLVLAHSAIYGCSNYIYEEVGGLKYFEGHTVVGTTSDADGILTIKEGTKYIDTVYTDSYGGGSHSFFFDAYIETSGSISLIMPDSIIEIIVEEDYNLYSTDDLGKVRLSANLKSIPKGLFSGCWALTEVTIPQGVETIGKEAFKGTAIKTVTVPSSVKIIEESAFNNCTKLDAVTFENGVETIGKEAFVGTIITTLNLPSSLKVIKEGAFRNVDSLMVVEFNEGLQTIETNAFKDCGKLGEIVLPSTLTTLSSGAFLDSSISKIKFNEGIVKIEENTFKGCSNLADVELPSTLQIIDKYAFAYCNNLVSITLPASVESVGEYAFGSCNNLKAINVLSKLMLNENVTTDSALYKGQIIGNAYYKGTILADLVDDAISFFYVKEGVTEIASGVFTNNTSLKCVYIPATVETIPNGEFSGCTNLTLAFADVPNPYKLSQMGATKYVTSDVLATQDGWVYTAPDSSGMSTIAGYYGTQTEITIPEDLGGSTMVAVTGFEANTNITKITMGQNVVVISENAFKNCTALTEVSISSTVYLIGANAFNGCSNLTTVNMAGDSFDIYGSVYEVGYVSPTASVSVTDADLLTKLKSTYVAKLWYRLPL